MPTAGSMMIFFWKINLPLVGLFAFGSQADWTWAFHAVAYALPVWPGHLVARWVTSLGSAGRFRSLQRDTFTRAGWYAAIVASVYVELWQGWAVKWNAGNFFDPVEIAIALFVGWILVRILD